MMWYGIWYMVYGIYYMLHGTWCIVYGMWNLVYTTWYMVCMRVCVFARLAVMHACMCLYGESAQERLARDC